MKHFLSPAVSLSPLSLPLSPFPSSFLPLHVIYLLFSVGPPLAWDTHGGGCRPPQVPHDWVYRWVHSFQVLHATSQNTYIPCPSGEERQSSSQGGSAGQPPHAGIRVGRGSTMSLLSVLQCRQAGAGIVSSMSYPQMSGIYILNPAFLKLRSRPPTRCKG